MDPEYWSETYLLTVVAVRRGWVTHVDNILPRRSGPSASSAKVGVSAKKAATVLAVLGGSGSASSSAGPAAPAVPPKISKADAKNAVNEDRKKAHNSMHCVLQYKFDADFCDDTRVILMFTNPIAAEHGAVSKRMKLGYSETVQQFAEWAAWSWVKPLCEVVQASRGVVGLQRAGFLFDGIEVSKATSVDHPLVVDQDAKAHQPWLLMVNILKQRAPSMLWHSYSFPGATARMMHKDPTEVVMGLEHLKAHVGAVEFHKAGLPAAKKLADQSMLEGAALQDFVGYAKATGYSVVNDRMECWMNGMWGGIGHTLFNERANQRVRCLAEAKSASKSCARMTRWKTIADCGFLAKHGWEEVKPTTHLPFPPGIF
jgi:hypothetical protein